MSLSVTTIASGCVEASGAVCAVVTGGSGYYAYDWMSESPLFVTLSTDSCLNNVPSGQYLLQVIDELSFCTLVTVVNLEQATLTLTSTVTNTQCAGADCPDEPCTGSMTLVPVGAPPYTVSWSDGFGGNDLVRTGLCAGVYTATIIDANGCSDATTNIVGSDNADPHGVVSSIHVPGTEHFDIEPDPTVDSSGEGENKNRWQNGAASAVNNLVVFPNPCGSYTVLQHEALEVYDATYCVRHLTGGIVLQGVLKKGNRSQLLDLDQLPVGVYLVDLTIENPRGTQYHQKLIKQ